MRKVEYVDRDGRKSLRGIPDDAPDEEAEAGVLLGPPPLHSLGLPLKLEVSLSNELFARGLLTEVDIRKRRSEAIAAIMYACRLDVDRLLAALAEETSVG